MCVEDSQHFRHAISPWMIISKALRIVHTAHVAHFNFSEIKIEFFCYRSNVEIPKFEFQWCSQFLVHKNLMINTASIMQNLIISKVKCELSWLTSSTREQSTWQSHSFTATHLFIWNPNYMELIVLQKWRVIAGWNIPIRISWIFFWYFAHSQSFEWNDKSSSIYNCKTSLQRCCVVANICYISMFESRKVLEIVCIWRFVVIFNWHSLLKIGYLFLLQNFVKWEQSVFGIHLKYRINWRVLG